MRKEEGVEKASDGLAHSLRQLFPIDRLRTGTPPRLDGTTIDYSGMERQESDAKIQFFSFKNEYAGLPPVNQQISCYITRTNEEAHEVIRQSLH